METPNTSTKMVANTSGNTKMQHVRILRPSKIGETIHEPGAIVKVDEATAKDLCDNGFNGTYTFDGERSSRSKGAQAEKIFKAERVSAKEASELA